MKSADRELQEYCSDWVCGEQIEIPPVRCSIFGGCVDTSTVPFGPGSYSCALLCLPCEPEWYFKEGSAGSGTT